MKPELLAPAGNWESLTTAVNAGADSIYLGVQDLNMRATAKNFKSSDLKKITKFCHENSVNVYLTLNTIVYESELKKIEKILKTAKDSKIDAIICWDLAILKLCNKLNIPIHLSTQASVSNFEAALYYHKKFNVERIVLARECTLDDIKKILKKIKDNKLKLEIETFIHGAMCVSISGRCFMSQSLFNKSANRGECIQPCRREYKITDEENKNLNLKNNYVMSPKDLCTLPFFEQLKKANIPAFKIEGRNRSPEYVKTVTETYRYAINNILDDKTIKVLTNKLKTVYNRGFSKGFFMGRPIEDWTDSYGSKAKKKKTYLGKVVNYYNKHSAAEIKVESHTIKLQDIIQIHGPTTGVIEIVVKSMQVKGKNISKISKGNNVAIKIQKVRKNDKVYKITSS